MAMCLYAMPTKHHLYRSAYNHIKERITWMDKVTNEDMLKRVDKDRSILNGMWQVGHGWIGHVLRHDSFLQESY